MKGVRHYNEAIALCTQLGDNGYPRGLEPILTESEEHVDWAETQLFRIEKVGIENYLSEQMGGHEH